MGQLKGEGLKVGFNCSLRLEFHGSKVTTDAGLLAYRELDGVLGLFDSTSTVFTEKRKGRNIQHELARIIGEVLLEHVDIIEVLKLKFDKLKLLKPDPYQMALALKI